MVNFELMLQHNPNINMVKYNWLTVLNFLKVVSLILIILLSISGSNLFAQSYFMNNTAGSYTTSGGFFYDSGGGGNNYSSNEYSELTFYPGIANTKISVSFLSFVLEANNDYLLAYDGETTLAPLIGIFSATLPPGGNVMATNPQGAITFRFTSSALINLDGWVAKIHCIPNGSSFLNMNPLNSIPAFDTLCGDYFCDYGGITGSYFANQNNIHTLYPSGTGNALKVSFIFFHTQEGFDGLQIFNGPDTTYPKISSGQPVGNIPANCPEGAYSGTNSPGIITSTDISGALTFLFKSSGLDNRPGWIAELDCELNNNSYVLMNQPQSIFSVCDYSFYDSGPNQQHYGNNENVVKTFLPSSNTTLISIDFGYINIAPGDTLTVYDGSDITSPVLMNISGTYNSLILTASNPLGALTVKFKSNAFVTAEGWNAFIKCVDLPVVTMTNVTSPYYTCISGFYDNGGPQNDYSNQANQILTVFPNSPNTVTHVNFLSFLTEENYDGLVIYNGPNTSSPMIHSGDLITNDPVTCPPGAFSGTLSPGMITSTHPTGALTFRFQSDGTPNLDGWEAIITCADPSIYTVADFSANTTNISTGSSVNFTDQSSNNPLSWQWTFTGGNPSSSTLQNPNNIVFATPGCYMVSLTVTNANGTSTVNKPCYIIVSNPLLPPIANFNANNTSINQGNSINFFDQSSNVPTNWQWSFPGGNPNSSTIQNPTNISYAATGCYNVQLICSNAYGSDTLLQTCYINVNPPSIPPVANFTANTTYIQPGGQVNFSDLSSLNPTSWNWSFAGGTPSTSTQQNPAGITFANPGCYEIQLIVTNNFGSDTIVQTCYITVSNPALACTELLISEYIEGAVSDRALELSNLSSASINLSNYSLEVYVNGTTTVFNTYNLSGILGPGQAFVLAHPSANSGILAQADATSTFCNFNGNDALVLKKNGVIIDVIGIIGNNPGSGWPVGTGGTDDNTLLRKTNIDYPTTSWNASQTQWDVLPMGDISNLGINNNNCSNTPSIPVANFNANLLTINAGQSVNFSDLSTGVPTSWNWSFQGATNSSSILQNPTGIVYPNPGCYQVSLMVSNALGSDTHTLTCYITVNTPVIVPVANFTANLFSIQPGQSISFTDLSTNNPNSWNWSFQGASPNNSNLQNPTNIQYNSPGCYEVTLTVGNAAGSDTKSVTCYINVSSGASVCSELIFSEYIEGTANDRALEFCNLSNTTLNLSDYNVELYSNGSTTATTSFTLTGTLASQQVYVVANASASAAILSAADATSSVCNFNGNDALVLKKNGVVIDVIGVVGANPGNSWIVGSGSTMDNTLIRNNNIDAPTDQWTLSQAQWIVQPPGSISNLGTHSSVCSNVILPPIAAFTANVLNITTGQSVNFTDLSSNTPTSWNWNFQGAVPATSSVQNPNGIVYNTAGCYQVSLTASNSSGSNTSTIVCYINVSNPVIAPVAAFTANVFNITTGQTVNFTDLSTNNPTTWNWNFQGAVPATSSVQNPNGIVYNNAGCYQVSLTASNSSGSNTSTIVCYINVSNPVIAPVAAFTANVFNITTGQTVNFTDLSTNNPTTWNWNFQGAVPASSTIQNPSGIVYNNAGCYQVSLTASNSSGSNTSTIVCYINVSNPVIAPLASFTANMLTITTGQSVNFTDLSSNTPTSWNWSFQGAVPAFSIQQNPANILYNIPGCYEVSLTASNSAGSNSSVQTCYITVNAAVAAPVANFNSNTQFISVGQSVNFNDLSLNNPSSWNWSFPGGTPSSSSFQNPTSIMYTSPGCYDVTLTAINSAGNNTVTQSCYINVITQGTQPTANFTLNEDTICNNLSVNLLNTSTDALTFEWLMPGGNPSTSNLQFPQVQYLNPGNYQITLIAYNGSNDDTIIKNITVLNAPTVNAGSDVSLCFGDSVSLVANSSASVTYTWLPSATLSTPFQNQTIAVPLANTTYIVYATDGWCASSDTVIVDVLLPPSIPNISQNFGVLHATSGFAAYQWFNNNSILPGEIQDSLIPISSGIYSVEVTAANGCTNISSPYNFIFVSNAKIGSNNTILFYPNPVDDILTIETTLSGAPLTIEMMDISGRIVYRDLSFIKNKKIDMSNLPPGLYMINVVSDNDNYSFKVLKL
jgi:PKD repeat protein